MHDLTSQPTMTPIAPLLLLIALLLLPFDVAVRRLLITRSDLARLRAAFSRRDAAVAAEPSPRFSSLMGAKARAQQQTTRDPAGVQPPTPPAGSPPANQPRQPRMVPEVKRKTQPETEENIAGKLLQRRKERDR